MIITNFNPFPIIETPRLILRNMLVEDAPELFAMRSNPETMRYIARPLHTKIEETEEMIKSMQESIKNQDFINWGVTLKHTNKVIGTIGFYRMKKEDDRAEIGYMLHQDFHKQGIMQEAIVPVIKYGFTKMNLHSIEGVIDPRNSASENVLLKNKFVKEAHFKEDMLFNGEYLDSAHYSLLVTNFVH